LPLWYRASFVVLGLLAAAGTRNMALRAACVGFAISHVLRVSLADDATRSSGAAVLTLVPALPIGEEIEEGQRPRNQREHC